MGWKVQEQVMELATPVIVSLKRARLGRGAGQHGEVSRFFLARGLLTHSLTLLPPAASKPCGKN